MLLLFKRNRLLLSEVEAFLTLGSKAVSQFHQALIHWCEHGPDSAFETLMELTHSFEHEADQKLHSLKSFIMEKSLLPEAREDLMILFECADDVIDQANASAKLIWSHVITPSKHVSQDFIELAAVSCRAQEKTIEAVMALFKSKGSALAVCTEINRLETIADTIESRLVRSLFTSDISDFNKLLLRDLAQSIGKISDSCDDAADQIVLIDVKRVI